jgi:hypothetical protein
MTTKQQKPDRTLIDLFDLANVRSIEELARLAKLTRQTIWEVRTTKHAVVPKAAIDAIASAIAKVGMADGSPVPSRQEIVRAWLRAKRRREAS